jgi:uncharacterized alkaline shock family protein YloU
MLPLNADSDAVEVQESSPGMAPEHLSDTMIADAIVHAIQAVPGVLKMGQGLFAKAATFGPGKHVQGIVIQHPTTDSLSIETHVILEEASFTKAYSEISGSEASSRTGTTPILLRFTDQIRAAVTQTLEHLGLAVSTVVNVTIDDIR